MAIKPLLAASLAGCLVTAPVMAQDQTSPAPAPSANPGQAGGQTSGPASGKVTIELNKLESVDQACRIYLLLRNDTATDFTALQLELVSFGTDGIINQRVAVDLAPLQSKKTLVKLFDVQGTSCDSVSRLLLNDTLRCEGPGGSEVKDCLGLMAPSSKGKIEFWK